MPLPLLRLVMAMPSGAEPLSGSLIVLLRMKLEISWAELFKLSSLIDVNAGAAKLNTGESLPAATVILKFLLNVKTGEVKVLYSTR